MSLTERLVCVGMLALVTVASMDRALDPDLGWHLRAGERMVQTGQVIRSDTFSWTMPGYPWVDHEWVTDIAMFLLYRAGGLMALGVAWMVIILGIALALFANRHGGVSPALQAIFVMLAFVFMLPSIIGVRPQMLSLLFLAVVALLANRERVTRSPWVLWLLPPLFCVWANLHGGFAVGLAYLAIVWAGRAVEALWLTREGRDLPPPVQRRALFTLAAVIGLGAAATLVNAYGLGVYREVLQTASDRAAMTGIGEWQSPGTDPRFAGLWVVLLAAPAIARFSRRAVSVEEFLVYVAFAALSIKSKRNVAVFAVILVPILAAHLDAAWPRLGPTLKRAPVLFGIAWIGIAAMVGCLRAPITWAAWTDERTYAADGSFPYAAVADLRREPLGGRGFNHYQWGGYLARMLPSRKVFIDGRMAIWRQGDYSVFRDFCTLLYAREGCTDLLRRYQFDWLLIPSDAPLGQVLEASGEWRPRRYPDKSVLWTPAVPGAS